MRYKLAEVLRGDLLLSGHDLESIGRQIVDISLGSKEPLESSAVRVLRDRSLNPEQVRRIIEFANTDAVNRVFASTSGDYRMVSIPGGPADPAAVVQALKSIPEGTEMVDKLDDYNYAPTATYTGSTDYLGIPESTDDGMEQKVAEAQVGVLSSRLDAAYRELSDSYQSSLIQASLASSELLKHAEYACKQGASLEMLKEAWASFDPEIADAVSSDLAAVVDGWQEGVVVKTAGRVNPEHPVCKSFAKFASLIRQAEKYAEAAELVREESEKLANLAVRGAQVLGKAIGGTARGAGNATKWVWNRTGDVGRGVAEGLGGRGEVGEGIGKGVLGIGALLGLNEADKELRTRQLRSRMYG